MKSKIIELSSVSRIFGRDDTLTTALEDINITINAGEFIVIMGPSGCGKTTLMNLLALLDSPTSGSVQYFGENLDGGRASRLDLIGLAPQDSLLAEDVNIIDNVALPLILKGVGRSRARSEAAKALEEIGLLHKSYCYPDTVSSGQAQLASMARMMVQKPSVILADEPTGNLDSANAQKVINILAELNKQGSTIVMVTHNPELWGRASRIIFMRDGKITKDSPIWQKFIATTKKPSRVKSEVKPKGKISKMKARVSKARPVKKSKAKKGKKK